ncbi:MAG: ABC transporter ATP-binding protein [Solobacterium sp.]|nr:ABC transporter ATP-binding protein [Solobacterium sp.]
MKLVVRDLNKSYDENPVLKDLTFTFEEGKIYGLLGRNGSGKTTFFSCLDDLIPYDSGTIYLEHDDGSQEALSDLNVGLVLTEPKLPEFLTGYEFIKSFMEICQIEETGNIDDYFKQIALEESDQHKLIKDYSMGMKNKIQMLMYLILKPKVLLLDEPLTSFDVIVASEIKEILKSLKHDHILLFSTHILELATNLCDEIVILNQGNLELVDSDMIHTADFEERIVEILKNE